MNCSYQILTEARRPKLSKKTQRIRWPGLILLSKNVVKQLEERFIYFRWSLDECPVEGPKKEEASTQAACDCHVTCTEEARLDRSFGNNEWFRLFPRSQTEYRTMRASDHRPIRVDFIYKPDDRGKGRFYFDQRLLNKAGIEKIVEKGWNATPPDGNTRLTDRIKSCRSALAKWKRTQNMNAQSNLDRLTKLLEAEIWKARNVLVFEKIIMDPASILRKPEEESNIWFELKFPDASSSAPSNSLGTITPSWKAPADDILKCNIAASWSESSRKSGAS
ncbi:hypothetical protein DY000_02012296 [Brassica cretica]|uniref:Endonuclease/exonuclease/phosphatase domain-containing protein n=1 Tax=Brassica cretica TaxID=69181 RepID=A0ABQ7CXP7_BRACR|nr:hypothetical protein DY000_02012296 [Brassica cretica]